MANHGVLKTIPTCDVSNLLRRDCSHETLHAAGAPPPIQGLGPLAHLDCLHWHVAAMPRDLLTSLYQLMGNMYATRVLASTMIGRSATLWRVSRMEYGMGRWEKSGTGPGSSVNAAGPGT
jgi:hypothetical protein